MSKLGVVSFFALSRVTSSSSRLCSRRIFTIPTPSGIFPTLGHQQHGYRQVGTTKVFPGTPNPNTASILEEWKTVYRFDKILLARGIQRLKVYQTGLTCGVFLPWTWAAAHFGYSSEALAHFVLGASVLSCVMLYFMGTMASHVIGILYVNRKDPTKLRISRLSFFGNRVDENVPADMFLPLTDSPENLRDTYVVLETVKNGSRRRRNPLLEELLPVDKYYLSLKYGTVFDVDSFTNIFGDVSQSLRK